jgi:hypothetical protein
MKTPLTILAIVAVLIGAFYLLGPGPDPDALKPRSDLPWQAQPRPDGSLEVFDLVLGQATLADAVAKFGALEGLALFEPADGPLVLEGYFGDVQLGPLKAKVVVGLQAESAELQAMRDAGAGREGSPTGDWKHRLAGGPEAYFDRRLSVIGFIPATRKLDQEFFRARFGEPAAWLQENEHAVSWFYPRLGLSVLIDEKASEVMEFQAPRDFSMPQGVTANPAY